MQRIKSGTAKGKQDDAAPEVLRLSWELHRASRALCGLGATDCPRCERSGKYNGRPCGLCEGLGWLDENGVSIPLVESSAPSEHILLREAVAEHLASANAEAELRMAAEIRGERFRKQRDALAAALREGVGKNRWNVIYGEISRQHGGF